MKFEFVRARFIKRIKRFFVFIDLEGEEFCAYCPNNGKMTGLLEEGAECLFSFYDGKLKLKWEVVRINGSWIGINPHNANILALEVLEILWPGESFKREVTFGRYRADFASKNKIIEVKTVHWLVENICCFPDTITVRGARQLMDLKNLEESGFQCFVIYICQRNDMNNFSVSLVDKNYKNNSKYIKSYAFSSKITIKDNILEDNICEISIDKEIKIINLY